MNGCYKDEATGVIFKHDLAYIKVRNLERVGDANSREYKVLQGNDVDAVWTIDAEAVYVLSCGFEQFRQKQVKAGNIRGRC